MYNSDAEVLFPIRVIPSLRSLRGDDWQKLIDSLSSGLIEENNLFAFILFMVRLGGCVNCNTDSFRAMRGCTQCAKQTINRYRGSDTDLLELFYQSKNEMEQYINCKT
jgi:hypothetical protein